MATLKLDAGASLAKMREARPLIHHLTNWVTINDCAQITRHWGCLPVMAHAREEVEEMASYASALVLNIGTLTPDFIDAMLLAAKAANARKTPVILDAVGAGATKLRTESCRRLIEEARVDILKGNAGEISALAGAEAEVRGVESISSAADMVSTARGLARSLSCVVAVSGPRDIVTDGSRALGIDRGHEMMSRVVGTGCVGGSTLGCFAAVGGDLTLRAAEAMAALGLAGELAAREVSGPGGFMAAMFDRIAAMDGSSLTLEAVEL